MADRKFLPDSENAYSIPNRNPEGFTEGEAKLLKDIGKKMNVNLAQSEGRIPSPFSRAYLFHLNLFATGFGEDSEDNLKKDEGRELLQERAQRTFRGLLATFALRKLLDLRIGFQQVSLDKEGGHVERLLWPAAQSAPRDASHWDPIRLFTVQRGDQGKREVLAGQSPLTVLYPAATPPKSLKSLYWYDSESGTWYDPTSEVLSTGEDSFPVAEETRKLVAALLKKWLDEAVGIIESENLEKRGLESSDQSLLQKELENWHDSIEEPAADHGLVQDPIQSVDGGPTDTFSFLNLACSDLSESIVSDLQVHEGRLLVRNQDLTNAKTRLFGRVTGSNHLSDAAEDLGREGSNLGRDLGLGPDTIPEKYLHVNELFAPKLTPVTQKGFSEEWDGIEIEGETYLLPFRPEILNLVSPEELVQSTTAEITFDDQYKVTLDYGDGAPIEKRYVRKGDADDREYVVDEETIRAERFDLRLFPNFRLDEVSDLLKGKDQKYYARVRLSPMWDFQISPVHHDDSGGVTVDGSDDHPTSKTRVGDFEEAVSGDRLSRGEALFITCEDQPSGFYVQNHGLCLLSLPVPSEPRSNWEVGIDFGTSNTCVSYRPDNPGGDDSPQVMKLPVFTTTLLQEPRLVAEFENPYGNRVDERASALLDFFYRQTQQDKYLNPRDYFPTQVVTRLSRMDPSPDWDFESGLIYFRNIGIGGAIDVQELIEGYPDLTSGSGRRPKRDFKVKQDLKWEYTDWMEAFMGHLRKHVALTAARRNAEITELKFSYPKAFTTTDRSRFRDVLTRTWGDLVDSSGKETEGVRLCSESEAVRNRFVKETGELIVLDIGGGTTDVIAFHDGNPTFQTSYRVAAGLINDYVAASPAFRRAFSNAARSLLGERYNQVLPKSLESRFRQGGSDSSVIKTTWIGLLNQIENAEGTTLPQILFKLRDPDSTSNVINSPEAREASKGFFLSVALLFTGTAFNAGMLLHAASKGLLGSSGSQFTPQFVDLALTGNGSKLIRMLHQSEQQFNPVIKKSLYYGVRSMSAQAPRFDLENISFQGLESGNGTSPKVSVSLGLLEDGVFASSEDETAEDVPLANIVAERGIDLEMEGPNEDLIEFYKRTKEESFKSPGQAPDFLARYLNALGEMLPKGTNEGATVLPEVGRNWHQELKSEIYSSSRQKIDKRIKKNASDLAKQRETLVDDEIPALESLFVVELRALLEQVREEYA